MAFIEGDRITGHETPHDLAERGGTCAEEKVKMIRDQGPGVALGLGLFEYGCQALEKRLAVLVIFEDLSSFYSPGHDVLKESGGV